MAREYYAQGLVVIDVSTPEFPFARDTENVKAAIKRFGIRHPVVQDIRYAIWPANNNSFWPPFYLVNKGGRVVYFHFSEENHEKTDAAIKELLAEPT